MVSASEQFTAKVVQKATGEPVQLMEDEFGNVVGFQRDDGTVVGIDPALLGMIFEKILAFFIGIVDKMREGGLCMRDPVTGEIIKANEIGASPLSEKERADALVATMRNPTRLQRARILADLKGDLSGTGQDAYDYMNATFEEGAAVENEQIIRSSVHEQEVPDFGYV